MIRALLYLQAMSMANAIRARLLRLKQPKYAFGALAGIAYLYFFLFRDAFRKFGQSGPGSDLPTEMGLQFAAIAAFVLLVMVAWSWIMPSARAALKFTEAEVAFLFPAPMTRRMLIHYKLLRSQLGILFSSILIALVLRRGVALGGNPFMHAAGWWLILSTLNLHFIGASFARERLLELGLHPARRRALGAMLLALVAGACWWWLRTRLPVPDADQINDLRGVLGYFGRVLALPPLSWLLLPFQWLVAPFFAVDLYSFLRALVPALGLLVAHYFWVIRSDVSFEEASIDVARQRAEKISAMRSGRMRLGSAPLKSRAAPFTLAPKGFVSLAFLWKNLIAVGPFYRLRTWLIACGIVIAGTLWLGADPARQSLLTIVAVIAISFAGWALIGGPMFMQREVRQTLSQLDILKSFPLRGWQIVLGELLSPMVLMTFAQWLLLLTAAMCFSQLPARGVFDPSITVIAAVAIALIAAPLCGLLLCVPYAGLLYFPAWMESSSGTGGGIEVLGQRLLMFGGYVVVMALSLLPAAALGGIAFLLGQWLGNLTLALLLTSVVAGAVLVMELTAAVTWLGEKLERFDLSEEMPR